MTPAAEKPPASSRPRQRRGHLYVLKVWPEERNFEGMEPVWRGSLNNIDGSNTRYFDNFSGLARLLREATGAERLFTESAGRDWPGNTQRGDP